MYYICELPVDRRRAFRFLPACVSAVADGDEGDDDDDGGYVQDLYMYGLS